MKKESLSDIFFKKIIHQEPYREELLEAIKNKEFVASGMLGVWAGLFAINDDEVFNLLLSKKIYPNAKSKSIHQAFFRYDCTPKTREEIGEKIHLIVNILDKTLEGKKSIIADIEKYYMNYGKGVVNDESNDFIIPIYQKYAEDKNKIYYLALVNRLKFFNTFQSKKVFEIKGVPEVFYPKLDPLINTPYWNRLKNLKFYNPANQEDWLNFCNKYKEVHKLDQKLPTKGTTIKQRKI